MVRSQILVALCAASGIEQCLAEAVRRQDVDADALSLLQKKAVVSRRAQEEAYSQTDNAHEWGLGDMFSSVVEAVHGAFQNDPDPADDKHALQLMEANKTVVTANNTARGVLHLVHGCHQCGFHFCDKASIKESETGIEDAYLVGTELSEWGCDKVVDPYVVHDKRTRKVYAVEFLETKPHQGRASKEEVSKAKTEVKHSTKLGVKEEGHSESQDKSVHKDAEAKTAGKKVADTEAKKSVNAAGTDATSKHKWPDFSLPHLEATDKIKEKISKIATAHAHSENSNKNSKAINKEKDDALEKESSPKSALSKTEKYEDTTASEVSAEMKLDVKDESAAQAKDSKTSKSSSDDVGSAGSDKEKEDNASSDKSVKSGEPAPKARQHPHDSSLMEHGVAMTEKEDLPDFKIPHAIRKVVERTEEKISSKFPADKKAEIKDTSTMHEKGSKLAANRKESTEEKKQEHNNAESVKSDKHEAKASQHPHDSLLMEHDVAIAEKDDFPNLKIPHMFHKVVETTEEKLSSKVPADKKSGMKDESRAHVKDSKLAARTQNEKKDERTSAKKVTSDTSDAGKKEGHSHSVSRSKGQLQSDLRNE